MKKEELAKVENIQVPCMKCENDGEYCRMCPFWQFAQLAYFKLRVNPMNSITAILSN